MVAASCPACHDPPWKCTSNGDCRCRPRTDGARTRTGGQPPPARAPRLVSIPSGKRAPGCELTDRPLALGLANQPLKPTFVFEISREDATTQENHDEQKHLNVVITELVVLNVSDNIYDSQTNHLHVP